MQPMADIERHMESGTRAASNFTSTLCVIVASPEGLRVPFLYTVHSSLLLLSERLAQ